MILRERFPDISERVLNLPPIRFDSIFDSWYKERAKLGRLEVRWWTGNI